MSFCFGKSPRRPWQTRLWSLIRPDSPLKVLTENLLETGSTKPQVAKAVLSAPGIQEALTDKLLVSICAGVTIEQLQSWTTPTTTVIRAMPNTPCKVRLHALGPNRAELCDIRLAHAPLFDL